MLRNNNTMKSRPSRFVLAIAAGLLVAGCQTDLELLALSGPPGIDSDTDTVGDMATTISSITIDPNAGDSLTSGTTGGDSDGTSGGSTDGSPAAPPTIESFSLSTDDSEDDESEDDESEDDPLVIQRNGPIHVYAEAHADGVRVELDDGAVIELTAEVAGVFRGELAITSAFANGDHTAKLVPFNEGYGDGEPALGSYTVDLPVMGSELLWAVDEYLGEGWVADVELLQNGDILEFGTLADNNNKRSCFLRHRTPNGAYSPEDVVILLGGDRCEAVGLEVRGSRILMLATWTENADRWWLGEMPVLNSTIFSHALGKVGETATAFDLRADGTAVVCGTKPSGFGDLDAFASVLRPGEQTLTTRTFDYVPEGDGWEDHSFAETPHDCLFVGKDKDKLMLVGDAYGKHDDVLNQPRRRRFFLPVDLTAEESDDPPPFVVAAGGGPGDATQSVATAADVDSLGRLLLTGYTCDLPCKEREAYFWVHRPDGTLDWFTSLGLHDYPELAPSGIRAHPAGYVVVGNGGLEGEFTLRAFIVGEYAPLWTYARSDPFQVHFPVAVTIGPYGQICAGGFGSGIYPGLACVGS